MANSIQNVGFSDYGAEQADIERRRQYAQALQQQGMQPLGNTETVGGWAIKNSPTQGLAKMLQAYSGRRGMEQATEQQKALQERYQNDYRTMVAKGLRELQGTPAQPSQMYEDAAGNAAPTDAQAAQAPDPMAALATFGTHPQGAALAPLAMQQIQQGQGAQAIAQALRGGMPPTGTPAAAPQAASPPGGMPGPAAPGALPGAPTQPAGPVAPPAPPVPQAYTPQQIQALIMSGNPQAMKFGEFLQKQQQAQAEMDQKDRHFTGVSGGQQASLAQSDKHWSNISPAQAQSNATTVRGQNMTDARAREANGIMEGGQLSPDSEQMAQAIAAGKLAPLSGFALNRPGGRAVMGRVMQINPEYSGKDFGTGQKAEKDFATGKPGQAVRSFNVALAHLDTLDTLSDALNNGNLQMVNKLGNAYAQQTGSPAPTNFESAKKIVADEIVKAIVGSGGGVADREAAAKTISAASSPAQLKGVIGTYKELMRGQLGGLKQQYETSTGRKDFDRFLTPSAKTQETSTQGAKTVNWNDLK